MQNNMAKLSAYLRFPGKTEEAMKFYRYLFGGDNRGSFFVRFSDIPASESMPRPAEEDGNKFIQIELPIPDGHVLWNTGLSTI